MPPTRDRRFVHTVLVFVALLAVAIFVRAWKLDAIPNPCADEGNWTWIPRDALLGRPATLPPDARFVPMTFARMIQFSFAHFGVSFASARAVLAFGTALGMLVTFAGLSRMGLRAGACVVAAVVAVHPWAVWWSRTVSVPYAFAMGCATGGPALFLAALRAKSRRERVALAILAGQVLFVGMHFSPLAVVPIAACGLFILIEPAHRPLLRVPELYVSFALGSLHAISIVRGALSVASRGSTRPDSQFDHFATRLYTYWRTIFGGLAGEATVRHFVGQNLPLAIELAIVAVAFVGITIAITRTLTRRGAGLSPRNELQRFAAIYFLVALVVTPLILAPARPWQLRAIDSERYLFALLAPAALLLGALAESPRRVVRIAVIATCVYFTVPTSRIAYGLAAGGGPDRGIYVLDGGGAYRGWRTPRELVAVPWLIQREVEALMHGQRATIFVADYAFHPIHFVNAETNYPTVDVTKFEPAHRPGERTFFVIWDEALFAPGYRPTRDITWNRALRARMNSGFDAVRMVRRFVQPNGSPLFEVWTGIAR